MLLLTLLTLLGVLNGVLLAPPPHGVLAEVGVVTADAAVVTGEEAAPGR